MPYILPENVTAPKDHWQHHDPPKILYSNGSDGFSVAEGFWDGERSLGIRWNGRDGEPGKGYPTVGPGNHASWFIVPRELEGSVRNAAILMALWERGESPQ